MIKSFKNKDLKDFFLKGKARKIKADHRDMIEMQLDYLDQMEDVKELLAFKSWDYHQLGQNRKGQHSIRVKKNWNIVFKFDAATQEVTEIDYLDYH